MSLRHADPTPEFGAIDPRDLPQFGEASAEGQGKSIIVGRVVRLCHPAILSPASWRQNPLNPR